MTRHKETELSYARASDNVKRKEDHIYIALNRDVEFHNVKAGFERYSFPHEALPQIDRSQVDTSVMLFGRRLSMPLMISPITGGTSEAAEYNRRLAEAAQLYGLAMGVGSQRVAIENPKLADTFSVRDIAPNILLFANLGAVQLNYGYNVDSCVTAIEMIGADALMLHLNPLQECVQPGGNTNFESLANKIADVCDNLDVPVVAKEVGHGISTRTARMLAESGVSGIDVAGAGGTSWAKIESYRSSTESDAALGQSMGEWGIPTVESLLMARSVAPGIPIIASGGVRSGIDIAKAIALGADLAGMALPLLRSASISREALFAEIEFIRNQLETAMFCAGAATIDDLKSVHVFRTN